MFTQKIVEEEEIILKDWKKKHYPNKLVSLAMPHNFMSLHSIGVRVCPQVCPICLIFGLFKWKELIFSSTDIFCCVIHANLVNLCHCCQRSIDYFFLLFCRPFSRVELYVELVPLRHCCPDQCFRWSQKSPSGQKLWPMDGLCRTNICQVFFLLQSILFHHFK